MAGLDFEVRRRTDPLKDTYGPAINILIKLLSMVSIVFAAVVVKFGLM